MNFSIIQNLRGLALRINVNSTRIETKISGGRVMRWNAPVILVMALAVFIVHLASQTSYSHTIEDVFTLSRTSWSQSAGLVNFLLYVLYDGGRWSNIASSMMLVVVLGPIIEERIGSLQLAAILIGTVLLTGVLHTALFTQRLYGPTCIAYMLVFLASFVNVKRNEIPVSFIVVMVVLLFVGAEQWSQQFRDAFPMIFGGITGMLWAAVIRKVQPQQ